jgi:hypothetical protein
VKRRKIVIAIASAAVAGLAAPEAGAATLQVCASGCPFSSINAAITAAFPGDTLALAGETFVENVVVNKPLTLQGAGQGSTIIMPQVSAPAPCTDSSLCGGLASNIILVRASNVRIAGLTLDGDNPALVSGVVRGGADLDARNGIITDHATGIVYSTLTVSGVTLRNVYLRGLYASTGGTFSFLGNTVSNVRGDASLSAAIFNTGGAGTISNNTIFETVAAIASNRSSGMTISNNTISNAAVGIHTDNAGQSGGAQDGIDRNTISDCGTNGYGLYAYVPTLPPRFTSNTVINCTVGMAVFGQGGTGTTLFQNNFVDGRTPREDSVGAQVSTDQFEFGFGNASVSFIGNRIARFEAGILVDESRGGVVDVRASHNIVSGNLTGAAGTAALGVHAENNFWGCNAGPVAPGAPPSPGCDTVGAGFLTAPWLVHRVTVNPTPAPSGGTATVIANLTFNSNGSRPGGGTAPTGTPVSFESVPDGTPFTPPTATLSGGIASSTFVVAEGFDVCAHVPADVATAALVCTTPIITQLVPSEACPATPYPLVPGVSVTTTGTTAGRVDDFSSFCGDITQAADAPDLVYAFTLPFEGTFEVDVISNTAGYNPAVNVRTDCATDELCFNFGAQSEVVAGNFPAGTYFIVVDGAGGTSGDFQLTATFSEAACGDGVVNTGEQCDSGGAFADDGCGDPGAPDGCQFQAPPADQETCPGTVVPIPRGNTTLLASEGNTTVGFANDHSGTCSFPPGGPDRVYQVIPQITGTMTVSIGFEEDGVTPICASNIMDPGCWDRVIYARTTCGDESGATELDCADGGAADVETITFPVTADTPVFVFVDGYDDQYYSSGVFNLLFHLQ